MCSASTSNPHAPDFDKMRKQMVDRQLRERGIRDERTLSAMLKVPRHVFVPEEMKEKAYEDWPLPIGHDQTISQPYIVAYMTEQLRLKSTDRVLEIGTGSGYQAAILAELAGKVYTIEIIENLQSRAKQILLQQEYKNIQFRVGDGWLGWPEAAPFDKIIVTAAASEIPEALVAQLAEGGRIILPVGTDFQSLFIGIKEGGRLKTVPDIPVRFVPLIKSNQERK